MYVERIDPIIAVLRQILRQARDFDRPQKEVAAVQAVLRKLMMIRELHSTWFVSIAGTQGAGKTNLLCELYGLQQWLIPNAGRGEKRPLFVIETQCVAPYATGITADGEEEEIDQKTLKAELDSFSGGMRYQLLRLYVPNKYFSEGFGFLLLPGYERRSSENGEWQDEMRDTLRHSMGSIMVTDQTRMADRATRVIIEDLVKSCLAGRAPLVAIARTEGKSEAEREELRQSAAQACGVEAEEMDRVICTGTGDAWREEWLPVFLDALKKYTKATNEVNRERLRDLASVVDERLETVVMMLEDMVGSVTVKTTGQDLLLVSMLDKFRAAADKYRTGLEKRLKERSKEYMRLATDSACRNYIAEEEGFSNKFNNLVARFKLNSGEIEQRYMDRIISNWAEQDERNPSEIPFLALTDMAGKKLNLSYQKPGQLDEKDIRQLRKEQGRVPLLLGYDDGVAGAEPAGQLSILNKNVDGVQLAKTMQLLLQENAPADAQSLQHLRAHDREISETLDLLPTLAMEYVRVAQAGALAVGPDIVKSDDGKSLEVEKVSEEISESFEAKGEGAKSVLGIVTAIAAVDIGLDGEFDIGKVLLGQPLVGVGAHVAAAAVGIVGLGYLGFKVSQAVAQYDIEKKNYIALCMDSLAKQQIDHVLAHYDEVIEEMVDRLSDNLSRAYGIDKDRFSERDALARSLYSLSNARKQLNKEIDFAQVHYLV